MTSKLFAMKVNPRLLTASRLTKPVILVFYKHDAMSSQLCVPFQKVVSSTDSGVCWAKGALLVLLAVGSVMLYDNNII